MDHLQIIADARKGKVVPVYLLHGEEPYFIDAITDYFEREFLDENEKVFNQTVFYGKDADPRTVLDALRRFPVMANRQLILIKEAKEMKGLAELESYLQKPIPQSILVIAYKYGKVDQRKAFAKAIKEHGLVFESKPIYDNKVSGWIQQYMSGQGRRIEPEACELLSEYVGNNLEQLVNELDKLSLANPEGKAISYQDVKANVGMSREFEVFDLQDSLCTGNRQRSMQIAVYIADSADSGTMPLLVGYLYKFFTRILRLKMAKNRDQASLMKELEVGNPFFLQQYFQAEKQYTVNDLVAIIHLLKEYDLRSKGVENVSAGPGELVRELMYRILFAPALQV